jgi:NDP-sugar pyrophosphorylase family protein
MFNILIPMAGRGQRFVDAGYDLPKPLIDVRGKPLIQRVVESLGIDGHYIFCVLVEHEEKFKISSILKNIRPNCSIIWVDEITQGAVSTCLLAEELINNNKPLIIANSDQIVEFNKPLFIGNTLYYDGCILTFPAFDKKWSFVTTDKDNKITSVVEKEVISTQANCGVYSWKRGSDFVKSAWRMIENDIRTNGEFYIAPVYNQMILPKYSYGYDFRAQMVDKMMPCGTPEDLETTIKVMIYEKGNI